MGFNSHRGFESLSLRQFIFDFLFYIKDNNLLNKAPVAQLDRVIGYEPIGREFESLRAHHFKKVCSPVAQSVERVTVNH